MASQKCAGQLHPIGNRRGLGQVAVYRTQRRLAKAGLKGRRVPDLVIAAQAELARLTMLHYDADFDLISSVTGQPTLWIPAQGSID